MEEAKTAKRLRALNNTIRRYFMFSSRRQEIEELTGNNAFIIGYLADNEGKEIYQKNIEEHFSIARSTASKVLGLMEEKGVIRRETVAADKRLKKIILTEKAWAVRELMSVNARELERTLLRGFTQTEIDTLNEYLQRMTENSSEAYGKE